MMTMVWSFLIYWLAMFVVSYIIVEVAQDQLYDEVTPYSGLKVGLGSLVLAIMLTKLHPSFDTMFTEQWYFTLLQAIVWFLVFMFCYRFHPAHAAGIGIITMLLISGAATLGVDSVMKPTPTSAKTSASKVALPVRQGMGPAPLPKAEAKK